MKADDIQHTDATADPEPLRREAIRCQRRIRSEIICSDVAGVVTSLGMLILWIYLGTTNKIHWSWTLVVLLPIWEVVFVQTFRARHRPTLSTLGEPPLQIARKALTYVDNQTWLQLNVWWWRYLPGFVAVVVVVACLVLRNLSADWTDDFHSLSLAVGAIFAVLVIDGLIYIVIRYAYSVSQDAALSKLETEREELLALLTSLRDETPHEA